MGPRSSISGELPIDSYFSSAGATRNKENGSLKRRTGHDADNANPTSTKKQRAKQPSKGADLKSQEGFRSEAVAARSKVVSSEFGTMTIPSPISVVKLPRSTPSRVSSDIEVIHVTSSSPPRATLFNAGDASRPATNTASESGRPTPPTVHHEGKRTHTIARLSTSPTVSHPVMQSGSAIPSHSLRPPRTPSRSKVMPKHISLACRTTPHSQRIVPSSQWSDDEKLGSASSLEADRNPILHRAEFNSYPNEVALAPPLDVPPLSLSTSSSPSPVTFKVPSLPTAIQPGTECSSKTNLDPGNAGCMKTSLHSLTRPPRTVSCNLGPQDWGQNSQIVPTSQFDEVELKVSSQNPVFVRPILPPQTIHNDIAPSVERSQTEPLQDRSPRSKTTVEQDSPSKDYHYDLSEPPSPLTPLSPSSPRLSDVIYRKVDIMMVDKQPSQHTLHKTKESPAPRSSPEPIVGLRPGHGGTAQSLPVVDTPAEDPTSDVGEDFVVHPSPVRRWPLPANVKNTASPAGDSPSASAHSHPRISHAKLRSLPDATVELDSDGEEIPSDTDSSVLATSQGISMSYTTSSYLDLVGTLPSAVGDFLDMVESDTFSDA